jgi:formylglycine-generating enzyme required for sulfatase activity
VNTSGPPNGVQRVIRGGHFQSGPSDIRASRRQSSDPGMRIDQIGFRCAKPG